MQTITSAATSLKQVPAVFKKVSFSGVNLDLGGGKYDEVQAYFESNEIKCTNLVFDPYNRSEKHNNKTLESAKKGVNSVTISNVLNVIDDIESRLELLKRAAEYSAEYGCPVYISVYEGNGTGKGKITSKGYQMNRKLRDYEDEIREVFAVVTKKSGYIIASNFQLENKTRYLPSRLKSN
jgi:hypothetical protein